MPEDQSGTFSSNTTATAQSQPVPACHLLTNAEAGGKTLTKITTTFTTTKITTKKMAIGDEREIAAFMAKPVVVPPMAGFETLTGSEEDTETDMRKVSFPQEPPSPTVSTKEGQESAVIYSGKWRKYGFRLFADNWHPVDVTIRRDGLMEWVNSDDTEHRHRMKVGELPVGMLALAPHCLDIPTYLSPKLAKGINADHLVAIGRRKKLKVKSYWFALENEQELARLKPVLNRVLGYDVTELSREDVRKVWLGQAQIKGPSWGAGGELLAIKASSEKDGGNERVQTPRQAMKKAKEQFLMASA